MRRPLFAVALFAVILSALCLMGSFVGSVGSVGFVISQATYKMIFCINPLPCRRLAR